MTSLELSLATTLFTLVAALGGAQATLPEPQTLLKREALRAN